MLDEVELGLGGVVAQDAVVIAALPLHAALVLLQVLRGQRRATLKAAGGTSHSWTGHSETGVSARDRGRSG